jgi:hypothetical protein
VSYLASFVLLVACVKLVSIGGPKLAAGVFTVGKVAIALLLGNGLGAALLIALIVGAISFGYFWLLNQLDGSGVWWVLLVLGVLLLAQHAMNGPSAVQQAHPADGAKR